MYDPLGICSGVFAFTITANHENSWCTVIQKQGPTISLFGRYYITKRTRQIAANLAINAAFLVVKIISIGHFLFLIIISSHSMLIQTEKLEFFPKFTKNPKKCLMNMLLQFCL